MENGAELLTSCGVGKSGAAYGQLSCERHVEWGNKKLMAELSGDETTGQFYDCAHAMPRRTVDAL